MAISKQRKEELVQLYADELEKSRGLILADYRGLTVNSMEELRRSIRDLESSIRVVKNRLLKLVLDEKGIVLPEEWLEGPTAIAFCYGELPRVAKALDDFAKDSVLAIKGGMMGADVIASAKVKELANLPPREVLLAQLLGTVNAPASQAASVVASGIRQVLNVLQAWVDQGGAEAPQAA